MELNDLQKQYEDAIKNAQEGGQSLEVIDAYIQLGHYFLKDSDTPKGLTQFEQALKIAQKNDHKVFESRLLGLIGFSLKQIGNYEASMQSYRKSLKTAKKIENLTLQLDALMHIGMLLAEQGKNLEAISKLDNALALSILTNDTKRKLHIANLLGNMFLVINSYEKAIENYFVALDASRALKNLQAEAASLIHLGRAFIMDEILDAAIENFEHVLDLSDNLDNPHIEIQALSGLMNANAEIGKQRLAVVYGEQLVNKAKVIGDPAIEIQAISDLCALLLASEKHQEAIPYLERGIEISKIQKDSDWELNFLVDTGITSYMLEDYRKADTILQNALELAVRLQKHSEEAVLLGHLSAIKADDGDIDTAIEYSERSLKLAREISNPLLEGKQLVMLALSYYEKEDKEKAVTYCKDAIQIFEELEFTELSDQAKVYLENFN